MNFQPVDRIPLWADWLGPFNRWHAEGLPEAVNDRASAIDYFGFEGMFSAFWGEPRVPVHIGLYPGFQEETLEETGDYRVYRTSAGTSRYITGSCAPSICAWRMARRMMRRST